MSTLHILWDESHIWGLLAARAARTMNLPYRLVSATDIAAGILQKDAPKILFVPGGNARHKAEQLSFAGLTAIQDYVRKGGFYLGFCGGAGLALAHQNGLGLCPWQRGRYQERLQHFMSGHLVVDLAQETDAAKDKLCPAQISSSPKLPVWWPGQFDAADTPEVRVLARYRKAAEDFWLADLPINSVPQETFDSWKDLYGLDISPDFLAGQPCVVSGEYGAGSYLLSYSHLETPDSAEANRWLGQIFQEKMQTKPACETLPVWDLSSVSCLWQDAPLNRVEELLGGVVQVGLEHGLLFTRTPWLLGWRTGMPGAHLNNLWTLIKSVREVVPSEEAQEFLQANGDALLQAASTFNKGCVQYLMAERLAMTLAKSLPDALPPKMLKEQREALFGAPMQAGGVYLDLVSILDRLAFLQLRGGV